MKRGTVLVIITIILFAVLVGGIYLASGSLFQTISEKIPAVDPSPESVEETSAPEETAVPAPSQDVTPASETPSPSPVITAAIETPAATSAPSDPDYYSVYKACLTEIADNGVYPDDTIPELLGGRTLNEPAFAICDVDQDGMDELLIQVTTTYSKGGEEAIYQCENTDGSWKLVLQETYYPLVTYYDNGLLLAGWQDGNGKEPDGFWPYYIYQYNKETGTYDSVGYVYSDNIYGDCFMIDLNDNWLYGNTDYYNQWFADFIGSATPLDITYQPITAESITSFFH